MDPFDRSFMGSLPYLRRKELEQLAASQHDRIQKLEEALGATGDLLSNPKLTVAPHTPEGEWGLTPGCLKAVYGDEHSCTCGADEARQLLNEARQDLTLDNARKY